MVLISSVIVLQQVTPLSSGCALEVTANQELFVERNLFRKHLLGLAPVCYINVLIEYNNVIVEWAIYHASRIGSRLKHMAGTEEKGFVTISRMDIHWLFTYADHWSERDGEFALLRRCTALRKVAITIPKDSLLVSSGPLRPRTPIEIYNVFGLAHIATCKTPLWLAIDISLIWTHQPFQQKDYEQTLEAASLVRRAFSRHVNIQVLRSADKDCPLSTSLEKEPQVWQVVEDLPGSLQGVDDGLTSAEHNSGGVQ
jgi:hypothetical protein